MTSRPFQAQGGVQPAYGAEPGPRPENGAIGVGPWDEAVRGPRPTDPRYDPELLADGDRRNVVDEFRYWRRVSSSARIASTRQ